MTRLRVCLSPGCPTLTRESYCPVHQKAKRASETRYYVAQRGVNYGARWKRIRDSFLRQFPLCVKCEESGRVEPATVVDHVQPHEGNYELFTSVENLQSLCAYHHGQKTSAESRAKGFGLA